MMDVLFIHLLVCFSKNKRTVLMGSDICNFLSSISVNWYIGRPS